MNTRALGLWLFVAMVSMHLLVSAKVESNDANRTRLIIDSDANNEVDDQHAIAYVLLNRECFHVEGITVNKTLGGGDIRRHAEEAERVVKLCNRYPDIRVYEGATRDFEGIRHTVQQPRFDGCDAVNFIVDRAKAKSERKLVILAIGKLTNVGLALLKEPSIGSQIRLVWLGSNYPDPGEYNFENDTSVVNFVLGLGIDFEMVVVRHGKPSGTAAVKVSLDEIRTNMRGKGPRIAYKVPGRHGGEFDCFGDYSISLFEHAKEKYRPLFDLAAAAIVKDPRWADRVVIHAPRFQNGEWIEQPGNPRHVVIWENFDRDSIVRDLFQTMDQR